jgi:transposase-like protein
MRTPRLPDPSDTWTPDEARSVLEEWQHSGASIAEFARREGLTAARLYWWRRRLHLEPPPGTRAALALVPAMVTTSAPLAARSNSAAVTVRVGDAVAIEIAAATPSWVATLVVELTRARS